MSAVPNKDKGGEMLNVFNNYNFDTQFTVKREINNSIPFLDVTNITNDNNILRTKWYRKPFSSGRYINYHSYHTYKINVNLILA